MSDRQGPRCHTAVERTVIENSLRLLRIAFTRRMVRTSARVALLVGTILNLANHWNVIVGAMHVPWFHVAVNYLIPYCVASYSAAMNELTRANCEALAEGAAAPLSDG